MVDVENSDGEEQGQQNEGNDIPDDDEDDHQEQRMIPPREDEDVRNADVKDAARIVA